MLGNVANITAFPLRFDTLQIFAISANDKKAPKHTPSFNLLFSFLFYI